MSSDQISSDATNAVTEGTAPAVTSASLAGRHDFLRSELPHGEPVDTEPSAPAEPARPRFVWVDDHTAPVTGLPPVRESIVVPPSPPRQGWAKPALFGGLIGALITGAISGGAILATRDETTIAPVTVASATDGSAVTSPSVPSVSAQLPLGGRRLSGALDVRSVLDKVGPAVVSVNTRGFSNDFSFQPVPSSGAGTGVVISADGYILTNNHVIENATSIRVTFSDRKVRTAELVGRDPGNDLALLRVDGVTGLASAALGSSNSLRVGDDVVAIGHALALPGGPTVTTGIVSAIDRSIDADRNGERLEGLIQTDAAINPGNSGGPLVNGNGEVIGINTAIISGTNNIGFAIAVDKAKPIIESLKKGVSSLTSQTFLGVSGQTVTAEVRDQFGLDVDEGALIAEVVPGSPADTAGIRPGDVVSSFGGSNIKTSQDLVDEVRKRKVNDDVEIEIHRNAEKRTVKVSLGSRTVGNIQ